VEHFIHVGEMKIKFEVVVRKPDAKRPLGRCRHTSENSINTNLKEIGCDGVDWTQLVQNTSYEHILIEFHKRQGIS